MLKNLLFSLYNISLKKAFGLSFVMSLFLSVPLIYLLLQREGQIFTEAGRGKPKVLIDESKIPYPTQPPKIVYVDKYYGKAGDSVLIYGKNFGAAQKKSQIMLNNKPVRKDDIVYWSDEELEFSLPAKTALYRLSVSINGKRVTWTGLIDVYSDMTKPELLLNEKTGFIKVSDPGVTLNIESLNGNIRVFGTDKFKVSTRNLPVELINSSVLYIEVSKGGVSIPYKVILQ